MKWNIYFWKNYKLLEKEEVDDRLDITFHKFNLNNTEIILTMTEEEGRIRLKNFISEKGVVINGFYGRENSTVDDKAYIVLQEEKDVLEIFITRENNPDFTALRNKKRLPFVIPTVCNYPFFTGMLGILSAYGLEKNWLFNNYLLLWCYKNNVDFPYWVDFKFGDDKKMNELCPQINKETLKRGEIEREFASIIDLIKLCIDREQYLYMSYDPYYIPEYWISDKLRRHIKHQCLVVSYNEYLKTVELCDFFAGKYQIIEVDYEVFQRAFHDYDLDVTKVDAEYCCDVELLSVNEHSVDIDYKKMNSFLRDFIQSEDTTLYNEFMSDNRENIVTGFRFLDEISNYINEKITNKNKLDVRCFYIIERFEYLMCVRIQYLEIDDAKLKQLLYELKNISESLIGFVMMYNVSFKQSCINNILTAYSIIQEKTKLAVQRFSDIIEERCIRENDDLY